jgi:thioredoxin reductase
MRNGVIGSGLAGYAAAVHAARVRLGPLVLEGSVTDGALTGPYRRTRPGRSLVTAVQAIRPHSARQPSGALTAAS